MKKNKSYSISKICSPKSTFKIPQISHKIHQKGGREKFQLLATRRSIHPLTQTQIQKPSFLGLHKNGRMSRVRAAQNGAAARLLLAKMIGMLERERAKKILNSLPKTLWAISHSRLNANHKIKKHLPCATKRTAILWLALSQRRVFAASRNLKLALMFEWICDLGDEQFAFEYKDETKNY